MVIAENNINGRAKHAFVRGRALSLGDAKKDDGGSAWDQLASAAGGFLQSFLGGGDGGRGDPIIVQQPATGMVAMGATAAVLAAGLIYVATR